jgi:hypothetical protein
MGEDLIVEREDDLLMLNHCNNASQGEYKSSKRLASSVYTDLRYPFMILTSEFYQLFSASTSQTHPRRPLTEKPARCVLQRLALTYMSVSEH